jgi:hypothetical protein
VVEGYKVVFSPTALEDIESCLVWLEEEAPEKVVEWYAAIKAHINTLRELPEAHPVAPQNRLWGDEELGQLFFQGILSKCRILLCFSRSGFCAGQIELVILSPFDPVIMVSPFCQGYPKTGDNPPCQFSFDPLERSSAGSYLILMKQALLFGVIIVPLLISLLGLAGGEERTFQPRTLMKPLPAIEDAPFVKAGEVKSIDDKDLVLALAVNGHSRAYPINMLTGPRREIINDTLGGTSIAATW